MTLASERLEPRPEEPEGTGGGLCFEDFAGGRCFALGSCEVGRDDIVRFARRYDPQPFHIDEQAAQATLLKGLAASGWHTSALLMRLLSNALLSRARYAGLLGIEEIRWLAPVRPGDRLTGRAICLGQRTTAPRPDLGVADLRCEAYNERGQRVMWWRAHVALGRRCGGDRLGGGMPGRITASRIARRPAQHGVKFFEDITIGDEIALGCGRLTTRDIATFRREFDPLATHPAAAGDGPACASLWHIAAVWMQKLLAYYAGEAQELRARGEAVPALGPSPGIRDMCWHSPVHAGDVLEFSTWAERRLELPPLSRWGLLVGGAEARNERGEVVVSFYANLLLERRHEGSPVTNGS